MRFRKYYIYLFLIVILSSCAKPEVDQHITCVKAVAVQAQPKKISHSNNYTYQIFDYQKDSNKEPEVKKVDLKVEKEAPKTKSKELKKLKVANIVLV
jgi:hypothetical protein